MVPRFTDEHGSSANSEEAMRIVSPGRQRQRGMLESKGLGPEMESAINHLVNRHLGASCIYLFLGFNVNHHDVAVEGAGHFEGEHPASLEDGKPVTAAHRLPGHAEAVA
ncbi:hypothetical protein GH733_009149 [Mirounga leonina]|nr:hypothetical protein GH733_009149 [Mirounga leonina]